MSRELNITGLDQLQRKLKSLPDVLTKELDLEVEDAALLWELGAKKDAPVDQGPLRNSISTKRDKLMQWDVVSPQEYSAFIEWGTKSRVRVPSDLQAYAQRFKGQKGATGVKELIFAWCKRVGIPEKFWYITFVSIMNKGIHPQPFFFVQKPKVEKELIKNIKRILSAEY